MEESSSLKLIMEKGPREGETLKYSSGSLVRIGRVVRGNTIAIKDDGISSRHMCIQFDNKLSKWTLCDLDSSNGTILNGKILKPYAPSDLEDGDCIKIGELTSIIVKIEVESTIGPRRNPRRQGKSGAGARAAAVVENGRTKLGLGFDGDLGENEMKEPVEKRNLRSRAKKAVDSKNEVESLSSRRILRSSKKEEVSFISTLKQIPENLNVDVREIIDLGVPLEPNKTRGRKKKMPVELVVDPDLDEKESADIVVPIVGKRTRGRRKGLPVEPLENAQSSSLEENINNANESVRVDEGNKATSDKQPIDALKNVGNSGLEENLGTNNKPAQDHVTEKLVLMQECFEGKEVVADESLLKDSSEGTNVDKGKEVAGELGYSQDGYEGLEKMTLGDFFDILEVQLPKEIYDKSEKIISDLAEKAQKCHEFRLQRKENRRL